MRKDYKYVQEATDLQVTTTEKGNDYVIDYCDEHLQTWDNSNPVHKLIDILLAVEHDYYIVQTGDSMDDWYKMYRKFYKEHHGCASPSNRASFVRGFLKGYLTIRLVIWD